MPKSMEERLNAISEQFKVAKAQYDQRFGGIRIDEGEYPSTLQRCELSVRRSDDATCVSVEYLLTGGAFKGFIAFDQMNLDNEWGRIFAIRFVEVSGYEFPDQEDPQFSKKLINTLKAIAKEAANYKIEIRHNGDFLNVIPKELITETATDEDEGNSGGATKKGVKPKESSTSSTEYPNFCEMERKELKKYIRENGLDIRVTAKLEDEQVRDAIREKLGISKEEEPAEKKPAGAPSDDELKVQLLALCKSQKIKEVKRDQSLDDMIDITEGYEFKRDELEDDEIELLEMLQLGDCIKDE